MHLTVVVDMQTYPKRHILYDSIYDTVEITK